MDETTDEGARQSWSRRAVLRSVAVGAGAAGTAGVATGQRAMGRTGQTDRIRGVIPEQDQYDQTVTGFFIHVGPGVDPLEASVADQCDVVDWSDEETLAYDVQLIDRKADPQETSITLYLNERVEVDPGTLFIINDREECQSGYLGISLEPVGVNLAQLRSRDFTPNPADDEGGAIGGSGPGLGVAGGLAGLLGGGWLASRWLE